MQAKDKILQAADRLFGENGFDAASLSKIAAASKINKALIHYHFKNKEGLFASVLDRYFEKLTDTLQSALLGEGTLPDRISKLIDNYIDFLEKNRNFIHIIQREINGGKQQDRVIRHMVPLFQMIAKAGREAYPATRSGDLAAEHMLISCYGMIITYFTCHGIMEKLLGGDPMSGENLRARKKHIQRLMDMVSEHINKT
jgi:TetR/AcrR family transcriptional regulator